MNKQINQLLAFFAFQAALIIVKLLGLITFSWWLVLIPLELLIVYVLFAFVVVVIEDPFD